MSVFTNPAGRAAADAHTYVEAVLDLVGDREPFTVLTDAHAALIRAIHGLSTEELRRPEAPGKWPIAGVLQHLADSEIVWAWRMRMILAQDRPTITGFDQDLWADRLHYAEASPAEALEVFGVLRQVNLRLIRRRPPGDLDRIGVHAERGGKPAAPDQAVRGPRPVASESDREDTGNGRRRSPVGACPDLISTLFRILISISRDAH